MEKDKKMEQETRKKKGSKHAPKRAKDLEKAEVGGTNSEPNRPASGETPAIKEKKPNKKKIAKEQPEETDLPIASSSNKNKTTKKHGEKTTQLALAVEAAPPKLDVEDPEGKNGKQEKDHPQNDETEMEVTPNELDLERSASQPVLLEETEAAVEEPEEIRESTSVGEVNVEHDENPEEPLAEEYFEGNPKLEGHEQVEKDEDKVPKEIFEENPQSEVNKDVGEKESDEKNIPMNWNVEFPPFIPKASCDKKKPKEEKKKKRIYVTKLNPPCEKLADTKLDRAIHFLRHIQTVSDPIHEGNREGLEAQTPKRKQKKYWKVDPSLSVIMRTRAPHQEENVEELAKFVKPPSSAEVENVPVAGPSRKGTPKPKVISKKPEGDEQRKDDEEDSSE
ncbi:unnamed protein product [Orchesella dallaii]|uniref:Uncharacterized protein n=1 Tax=Orchesella dallaii TaxID=48710 RepID=A0ABP1R1H8_9HEXA